MFKVGEMGGDLVKMALIITLDKTIERLIEQQ
jgi:hypothetical protein